MEILRLRKEVASKDKQLSQLHDEIGRVKEQKARDNEEKDKEILEGKKAIEKLEEMTVVQRQLLRDKLLVN